MLLGQLVDDGHNGLFKIILVQRRIGDKLGLILLKGVKDGVAILVLVGNDVLFLFKETGALVVCNLLHPFYKSGRLLQIADGIDNFNKGLLSNITGDVLILYRLKGKVVNVVIKLIEQVVKGLPIALLGFCNEGYQLFSFHFALLSAEPIA